VPDAARPADHPTRPAGGRDADPAAKPVGGPAGDLAAVVAAEARRRGIWIGVAESLTGGLVA